MIIDAHTHLFPDAMAERVLHKLVENTRPFVSTFGETKPHTDATVVGLTASQKKAGIDLSLVLPIATSPKPSPTLNNFAAQVNALPGLRSFGSVHPLNPQFREELDRIADLGLKGIKRIPNIRGVLRMLRKQWPWFGKPLLAGSGWSFTRGPISVWPRLSTVHLNGCSVCGRLSRTPA